MEPLTSQLASNVQLDTIFFEICLKKNRRPIATLEKKDGKYELTLPPDFITVDGIEFLKLLQKGIEELEM